MGTPKNSNASPLGRVLVRMPCCRAFVAGASKYRLNGDRFAGGAPSRAKRLSRTSFHCHRLSQPRCFGQREIQTGRQSVASLGASRSG